jgi:limonene-1,2-epoxide hydrolase
MINDTKSIALAWFESFNAHNLEQLLQLYHEHAEHYSPKLKIRQPETRGLIKGKPALHAWWQDAFNRLPTLHYEVLNLIADDERVFMDYIRHVEGEEDLRVGEVLEIENGKIKASRVYHC